MSPKVLPYVQVEIVNNVLVWALHKEIWPTVRYLLAHGAQLRAVGATLAAKLEENV